MTKVAVSALEQFRKLFRGHQNAHGEYGLVKGEKRVKTEKTPIPDEMWESHLAGEGPFIGVIPIREDSQCYFGALDVDDDEIDHVTLAQQVQELHLPLIVCRSKSGGAHLYVFFKEPVPAKLLIERLKIWADLLQLKNPDGRAIEIFPKQHKLSGTRIGNWINLPYYGGDETDRYAVLNGETVDLLTFVGHATAHSQTLSELEGTDDSSGTPFLDGPPCLITLHLQGGFPEGARNDGMLNAGIYFKSAYPGDWEDHLTTYNTQSCDPPLDEYELKGIITSLHNHDDYIYMCAKEPIASVCNKAVCSKRGYGIRQFHTQVIDQQLPEINGLMRLETDPAIYFLSFTRRDNQERHTIELGPEEILHYYKLKERAFAGTGTIMPSIKQVEWETKLAAVMGEDNFTVIQAPEDAGPLGQFQQLLREFLNQRRPTEATPDVLLLRKPFESKSFVYFRSGDLISFLDQKRFRDYKAARLYKILRDLGGSAHSFKVKGAMIRAWSVPVVFAQTEKFDEPEGVQNDEPDF
jgi:hypothetical protein